MRRLDIEDVLGELEMPDVTGGEYLVGILWKVGPIRADRPLDEADLQAWERRRGIEFEPWQADLLIDMSKAYMSEMHAARQSNAVPPWPPAVGMWHYVRGAKSREAQQVQQAAQELIKENTAKGVPHGNRKRR